MPSLRTPVWSCIRPDRTIPDNRVRPWWPLEPAVLIVFCFFFPTRTPSGRAGVPGGGGLHPTYLEANGLRPSGLHHEVYLSDPRKTAPEKLKTVLRQPVEHLDR